MTFNQIELHEKKHKKNKKIEKIKNKKTTNKNWRETCMKINLIAIKD